MWQKLGELERYRHQAGNTGVQEQLDSLPAATSENALLAALATFNGASLQPANCGQKP